MTAPPIAKAREFQKSMEDSNTIPGKAREFQKSMEDSTIQKAREFQKSMEDSTIQKAREFQKSMEDSSLASSICSTLDDIQPPSMMNSLISMSEKPSLPNSPRVSSKFECRHSSNKKLLTNSGHRLVPETVRTMVFCFQNCSDLL